MSAPLPTPPLGTEPPGPGVYRNVAHEVYHSWPYASNSRLAYLVPPSTPAKLRQYLDEPPKEKKVWKEGRILHACILEPERYEHEYRVARQCAGTTGKGARCSKPGAFPVTDGHEPLEACHLHVEQFRPDPDSLLVSAADDAMARGCLARWREHALASGFLNVADAEYELSIVWDQPLIDVATGEQVLDPATGEPVLVRCKARLDWCSQTFLGGLAMDLKGAREAHPKGFKKAAHYNGYLRQAVFYRLGLQAVGLPSRTFAAVAQEKEGPLDLWVHRLGDAATGPLPEPGEAPQHVAAVVFAALRVWHWCHETGEWPGYPETVNEVTTDEWMWSEMDQQAAQINDFLNERAA